MGNITSNLDIYKNKIYSNYIIMIATGLTTVPKIQQFRKDFEQKTIHKPNLYDHIGLLRRKGIVVQEDIKLARNEKQLRLETHILTQLFLKHLKNKLNISNKELNNKNKSIKAYTKEEGLDQLSKSLDKKINKEYKVSKSKHSRISPNSIFKSQSETLKNLLDRLIIEYFNYENRANRLNLFSHNLAWHFDRVIWRIIYADQINLQNALAGHHNTVRFNMSLDKHKEFYKLLEVCKRVIGFDLTEGAFYTFFIQNYLEF